MPAEELLRNAESNAIASRAPSFYTGTGRQIVAPVKVKGKKKGGLAALIIMIVMGVGGGAFLGSTNSLLAPALESLVTEQTDTQYTSNTLRFNRLFNRYLKAADGTTQTTWRGTQKYSAMSMKFKNRLKKNGIEVVGFGNKRVLHYYPGPDVDDFIEISADQFLETFKNDPDFREAFTTAKRGRVASFFDNVADRVYDKLGITRNLFDDYKTTGNADADEAKFRETMTDKMSGGDASLNSTGGRDKTDAESGEIETDADGNPVREVDTGNTTTADSGIDADGVDANTKASQFIGKFNLVTGTLNAGCAALKVINMINVAVAANEIYQSINYFMGLMENVSKMKAGEGSESAINEVLNFLTTSTTTDVSDFSQVNSADDMNQSDSASTTVTGTALEANGVQLLLANAPIDSSETANYSLDRITNTFERLGVLSGATITGCAVAGIAESVVSIATGIATFGVSIVVDFVITAAISGAVAIGLSFLIPTIAQALFTNAFETATGIPAGELFAKGASASNTRLGRSGSGQSLSSAQTATAYNQATQTVLAMDAEVDRISRSPFDITSKNTFFGSIAYKLATVATTSSTLTNIGTLMHTTSTSLASLTGSVSASGENSSYMTTYGDCPNLESIGAVGDIYCNPVTTTDLSTVDLDPYSEAALPGLGKSYGALIDSQMEAGSCDENGDKCKIKSDSNLALYITYCDDRDSPFGVVDSNILGQFNFSTGSGAFDTIINSAPIIGDAVGIFDAFTELDSTNQGWANGANCVASSDNPMWNELKYYQRYVEDQRLLEQMGAYEDSRNPVTAYQEAYDEANPLDTSTAGLLAHYTGLSKDDAEFVIALIDYSNFIAEYDPDSRLALDGTAGIILSSEEALAAADTKPHFEDNGDKHPVTHLARYVVYADVRNRSHAA